MKRYFRHFGVLSLAAGVVLFLYLIQRTGVDVLLADIRLLGLYFPLIILISGFRHFLRTWAWQLSMPSDTPRIGLARLFSIRLIGETVTDLTFAGPALGEPVKALAVSRYLSTTQTLSSIVVENLIFSLSVVIFLGGGMLALIMHVAIPEEMRMAGLAASSLLILPALAVYWVILRRWMLASRLVFWLKSRFPGWDPDNQTLVKIQEFETGVYGFCQENRTLFFFILGLELMTHLCGVMEAWLVLKVVTAKTSLLAAYLAESSYRVINILFAFVPLRFGVDESGTALTLKALGWTGGTGVALALIRKIRFFFWMAVGLIMAGHSLRTAWQARGKSR